MASFDLQERIKYLNDLTGNVSEDLASFISFGKQLDLNFDYSLQSLDKLELILSKLAADFAGDKKPELYEDCWLYLGETYRKKLKGRWEISDDEEYNPTYFGLPVITGFDAYNSELCPMIIINTFIKTPKQGLLKEQIFKYK